LAAHPRHPVGKKRRAICAVAFGLAISGDGFADSTPSLALTPAPAGDRGAAVERAGVHGHWLVSARIATDYASEPLVLRNDAQELDRVVTSQMWLYALGSVSIAHRFLLHATFPLLLAESGDPPPLSGATAERPSGGFQLGDARLGARFMFFRSSDDPLSRVLLAFSLSTWLPTASQGYAGDGAMRVGAGLVADGSNPRLYWALNGGFITRPSEQLGGVTPTRVGNALNFGAAAGFFADGGQKIAIGAELISDLPVGNGARLFDPRATVAHLLLVGHWRIKSGPFELGAAGGPGIGQGAGSADFRVLALVGLAPRQDAPLFDTDADGIPDASDACVDLPGVRSGDPLLHGCPAAPLDTDGDAIPDQHDACPSVPGEPTGVRTTHGCPPDFDTDGDGVADKVDACPREPGVPPPGGNGCPKTAEPAATKLVAQNIVLSQQVQFETATSVLRPESDGVLSEVARVLGEHPEVEEVEVQGHTDEQGTAEFNRRLGQGRAEAVVNWLVQHGIRRDRLKAKGYGADRAIAENVTEEGRQKNRRVEFRVTRMTAQPSPERKETRPQ
jgi:outer membrane protein OmpA-like peptidoglycan-associated protein